MTTKKLKKSDFKHGMTVGFKTKDGKAHVGKISIDTDGNVVICQNVLDGYSISDKLGYTYSYLLFYGSSGINAGQHHAVAEVFIKRSIEHVVEGDIVHSDCNEYHRVLGICGQVVFLSSSEYDLEDVPSLEEAEAEGAHFSIYELKDNDWTLVQEESHDDEVVEYTLEDVAEKMGVDVKKLRIKD